MNSSDYYLMNGALCLLLRGGEVSLFALLSNKECPDLHTHRYHDTHIMPFMLPRRWSASQYLQKPVSLPFSLLRTTFRRFLRTQKKIPHRLKFGLTTGQRQRIINCIPNSQRTHWGEAPLEPSQRRTFSVQPPLENEFVYLLLLLFCLLFIYLLSVCIVQNGFQVQSPFSVSLSLSVSFTLSFSLFLRGTSTQLYIFLETGTRQCLLPLKDTHGLSNHEAISAKGRRRQREREKGRGREKSEAVNPWRVTVINNTISATALLWKRSSFLNP